MAVSSWFVDNNMSVGQHLKFQGGAQFVDFKPVFITTAPSGADDWNALAEKSMFYDENGIGWKLNGQRTYFQSEADVNTLIANAVSAADSRHFFDPTTQTSGPVSPNGSIKAGDTFVVSVEGTWDGISLKKGDILEAFADITGTPLGSDFLLNRAQTGLENVPNATTAFHGIVKLLETIRLDGSATHTDSVTTEKAVADAIIAVRDQLNLTITQVQTTLQTNIDANTALINSLDARVATLEGEMDLVEAKNVEQDTRLTDVETKNTEQDGRLTAAEADISGIITKNTEQDSRLNDVEAANTVQDGRLSTLESEMDAVESKNTEQDGRLSSVEAQNVVQDGKIATLETEMDAVEAKNTEQDGRLTTVENEVDSLQANDSNQDNRLTALEEWTMRKVTIALGDGVSEEFVANIPGIQFKDTDIVGANLMAMKADGSYKKNGAMFPFEVYVENGIQKVKANFAYAPAAGAYAIMLTGLAKDLDIS